MPQQVPGISLPEPDQQQQRDVMRLLYQYGPTFREQHPWLATGLEIGAELALQKGLGRVFPAVKTAYNLLGPYWIEGIAPRYRHPMKKEMMKELREQNVDETDFGSLQSWQSNSPLIQNHLKKWRQVIADDGAGGPYDLQAFRGERTARTPGRGAGQGPVPGRGRFHAAYPSDAMMYVSGAKGRHGYAKQLRVEDIKTRRPLVVSYKNGAEYDTLIKEKLGLSADERRLYDKLFKEAEEPHVIERFVRRAAKAAGYDSILTHNQKTDYMDLITLEQ